MTEQQIQKKRIIQLEEQGYYVIKLVKTNNSNVLFSEVKKPNGKLTPLQEFRLKELKRYGFKTEVYKG